MQTITAITPQIKDKDRCNIYLDNVFYCGLNLETVIKYKLKVGQEVDRKSLLDYQYDSEKLKALDKAMGYISKCMKTEKQIEKYLKDKGYGETVIFFVNGKLKEYSFINDSEYARSYFNTYKNKKGKKLIQYELKLKGISEEDIEKGFSSLENYEENSAITILSEKYMRNKEISRENISKLYKHLLSKGFSYEEIDKAIRKLKEDIEEY